MKLNNAILGIRTTVHVEEAPQYYFSNIHKPTVCCNRKVCTSTRCAGKYWNQNLRIC